MAKFTLKEWAKQNEIKSLMLAQQAAGRNGDLEAIQKIGEALRAAIGNLDSEVSLWGTVILEKVEFKVDR